MELLGRNLSTCEYGRRGTPYLNSTRSKESGENPNAHLTSTKKVGLKEGVHCAVGVFQWIRRFPD